SCVRVVVVGFFFQAEDGIRDGHVTGVQTCALPISAAAASRIPSSLEEKRAHRAASTSRSRARPSSRTQAMKTPKSTAASVFAQARGRETEERPRRRKDVRAGATVPRTSFGLAG